MLFWRLHQARYVRTTALKLLVGTVAVLRLSTHDLAAQATTTSCSAFANRLNCTSTPLGAHQNDALVQLGAASLQAMAVERAAETQAAWAVAGRAAEQAAIVARQRAEQTSEAIPRLVELALANPPTLQPVNTGLSTDWKTVDGVSLQRELKLEQGIRRDITVKFAVVPTPEGNSFVQLRAEGTVSVRQGLGRTTVAREVADGRYDLRTGVLLLTSSREPLRADVAPMYESLALIGEQAYVAKMGGAGASRFPLGVVPTPVLNYTVAAIKGELPDSLRVWVLDWDTGTVMPAEFTVRERARFNIPMAKDGESCAREIPTKNVGKTVVIYRTRIGVREEERIFLAESPHLPVDDGITCMDLLR